MATPYETIYIGFYKKKLVNDKKFFKYNGLTVEEIEELVREHSYYLMVQAVDEIYKYGVPQIDFYNRDDTLKQFNEDLTTKEIGLIQDIMYLKYYDESKNKINSLGLIFKNAELNVFSPSAERTSILNMCKSISEEIEFEIVSYLNRDRLTNKIKKIN